MIEESLVKSHFVGRDGFRWWIGQVAPEEAQGEQINGGGWGNRIKVRIMGYHPGNQIELPDEELPWCQIMLGGTDGTGGANRSRTTRISPGDTVIGFFLDGDNGQQPIVMGAIGRTAAVSSADYQAPFVPFTGYTKKIKNDGNLTAKNEVGDQSGNLVQESPRHLTVKHAKQLKTTTLSTNIGKVISLNTQGGENKAISAISNEVNNFVTDITNITDNVTGAVGNVESAINSKIDKVTGQITDLSSGMVGSMVNGAFKGIEAAANPGMHMLYDKVNKLVFMATKSRTAAHKAGVAAQKAMVPGIGKLTAAVPCVMNKILGGLGGAIKGLISGIANNVKNFVSCIADQFLGGLMNQIIGGITGALSGIMGLLGKILPGFDLEGMLRGKAEGLLGMAFGLLKECGAAPADIAGELTEWVIGIGPKSSINTAAQKVLGAANTANSMAKQLLDAGQDLSIATGSLGPMDFLNPNVSTPGFSSGLGECFAGLPQWCGPPEVKFFGSAGTGAIAEAVIGSVVGAGRDASGSVIGVNIKDGGSGYDVPPYIELVDPCQKGYGAMARAVIKDGKVVDAYVISEGEGYPVNNQEPDTTVPIPIVVVPGSDYEEGDTVTIGSGETTITYPLIVDTDTGMINDIDNLNTDIINIPSVKNIEDTEITINSATGHGAFIRLTFRPRPTYQGKVLQVIDCVS